MLALVRALKSVDLPTLGRPTMPHLNPMLVGFKNFRVLWRAVLVGTRCGLAAVQTVHRFLQFTGEDERHLRQPSLDCRIDQRPLRRGRPVEHGANHEVLVPWMPDTDTQAVEGVGSQMRDDAAQAVMSAVSAALLQANDAGRKIHFIMDHQQFFRLQFEVIERLAYRSPALVHIGEWLYHADIPCGVTQVGVVAMEPRVPAEAAVLLCEQAIHKPEPGVMPGSAVVLAGVAQTRDDPDGCSRHADPLGDQTRGFSLQTWRQVWRRPQAPPRPPRQVRPSFRPLPPAGCELKRPPGGDRRHAQAGRISRPRAVSDRPDGWIRPR